MKNAKKIGIALLLVVLIGALAIFTALAAADSMYTGSIYWLEIHVERFEALADSPRADREAALTEIDTYLSETPVNPDEEGYAALAEVIKKGKIRITKEYLADISAEGATSATKAAGLQGAKKWFELTPYTAEDMEGQDYKDIVAAIDEVAIPVAEAMLQAIDKDNLDDLETSYNYKIFSSFMKNTEFDEESDEYKALKASYDEIKEKYEAAIEARKQALYAAAPLDEYGYGTGYTSGFEAGNPVPGASNVSGTNSLGVAVKTETITESETYINDYGVEVTNNYRTMRFNGQGKALSTYFNVTYSGAGRGMVYELDITTMSQLPNAGIIFQTRPNEGTNTWLSITSSGVMTYRNGSETKGKFDNNDKIIVPGEWTHISLIFDPANRNAGKLYIDYILVASDLKLDYKNWGFTPALLRIGNTASMTGEFSIDNLRFTIGTAHRDDQYINKLPNDTARFLYYADYLCGESNRVPSRVVAYQRMTDLITKFAVVDDTASETAGKTIYKAIDAYKEDEKILDAITVYNNSDAEAIRDAYMNANLAELQTLVADVTSIVPNPSNISDRNSKINLASSFIENNQAYITPGDAYDKCQSDLAAAIAQLELDTNVSTFIITMQAFAESESLVLLELKYQEATTLLETIGSKKAEMLAQTTGYEEFKTACDVYQDAAISIGNALGMRNSKDIVVSVNYVLTRYPDESDWRLYRIEDVNNPGDLNGDGVVNGVDVDLAVQNNADFDFIDNYLTIIRAMIKGGYDENYIGVDGAIQRFDSVNAHYYDILQKNHAEHIEEQLDILASTQSFISKEGIIAYLKRYKESNDVDVTHASIAPLQVRMDAYEEELKYQVDTYAELLRQNTSFFVNKVMMFDTAITYLEKKALFDDATLYYYEMNATSDEIDVASAIVAYNRMAAELAVVDNASAEFIRNVSLLPAAETSDDYYRYLIGAMLQYENIDESIEGVTEAKAKYLVAYNEYCAEVDATNSEICETGAALGSLRANCGLSAIISAFIERIFNF